MVSERLDVRLDPERRRKLRELAERENTSVSEIVRTMIDRQYEDEMLRRRKLAVERMSSLEIEDVPDPEELSRQLGETHDLGRLY